MNDLNFFEEYVETKELKLDSKLIYISIFSLSVIFLIGYIAYNSLLMKGEREIITSLRQVVENPDSVSRVGQIIEKENQLNALQASVDQIKLIDTTLSQRKKLDETLLKKINSSTPNNVFLTSLNIEKEEVFIVGISKDKLSVAEFQRSLESLEDNDEVFVSHISLEDDYYNFALDITVKEIVVEEVVEVVEGEEGEIDAGTN